MKADVLIGISDVSYADRKKPYGPVIRFSITHRFDLEDGRILGDTIPGFLVRKKDDGSFYLIPPVRYNGLEKVYHAALITQDEKDLILSMLGSNGYLKKVGTNNNLKKLKDLEPDLLSDLPANVTHR